MVRGGAVLCGVRSAHTAAHAIKVCPVFVYYFHMRWPRCILASAQNTLLASRNVPLAIYVCMYVCVCLR